MGRRVRGSVYQLPSGKWRVRVRRHNVGVYDTEGDARFACEWYISQLKDVIENNTFAGYGQTFLDRREKSGRVKHVKKERSRWNARVETAPFAMMPLRSVKHHHIAQWVRDLLESPAYDTITLGRGDKRLVKRRPTGRPISRSVVTDCLSLVRLCLREATDDGLIPANPAGDVKVPRTQPKDPVWTWLTEEEIEAVRMCQGIPEDRRLLFTIAIYTGLRASELWRLRWERVELGGDMPRVEVRAPVKTQQAIRDVPLLPEARAAFAQLREWGGVRRISGLVWPREDGDPHGEWDGGWRDHKRGRHSTLGAKTRAGIERPVRFHDLRHTCASHLVQGTWTDPLRLEEARQWLGHSSIIVTQRYAHLSPENLHRRVCATKVPRSHEEAPK